MYVHILQFAMQYLAYFFQQVAFPATKCVVIYTTIFTTYITFVCYRTRAKIFTIAFACLSFHKEQLHSTTNLTITSDTNSDNYI